MSNPITLNFFRVLVLLFCTLTVACEESRSSAWCKPLGKMTDHIPMNSPHAHQSSNFFIDSCSQADYTALLEGNKALGKDSCIVSFHFRNGKKEQVETLNVPIDRSSINYCEKDYVVVGFACGGPCYSQVFVFHDGRDKKQFTYSQPIVNNSDLIAHIRNEEFEKLVVSNLKNGKEILIDISDNDDALNFGRMDTLFVKQNVLHLRYPSKNHQKRQKTVPLNELLD